MPKCLLVDNTAGFCYSTYIFANFPDPSWVADKFCDGFHVMQWSKMQRFFLSAIKMTSFHPHRYHYCHHHHHIYHHLLCHHQLLIFLSLSPRCIFFFFIFLQFPFLQCLSSLWPSSSSSLSSSSSSPIFPLYKRHISCIHWRVSFSLSPFWVFVDPCSHPDGTAGPAFSVSTAKHRTWAPKMSLQMMRTAFLRTTWGGGALCFFPGVVIDAAAAWASAASCHISYFRPMGSSTALLTAMGLCPWWVGIHSHRHLWGSLCLKWW